MAGRVLKAQKVSDPIVRTVEIRDMYDHSLNDLEDTWNDLGKLKSTLRNIGHRVDDAADVRPAVSAGGISQEPLRKAKQPGEPLESLPHYRPRKVCRLDEKYLDNDADGHVNVPPYRPASRHVAFKNFDSGDDTGSRLSSEDVGADAKNASSFNMTDSRAERETERKFLNDSVSPVMRGSPEMQRVSAEPEMEPWLRRVNVRVPKAPTTTGVTSIGESSQANFDVHRKRPTVKDVTEGDLSKLQETVRRQRAKSSQTVGSDVRDGSTRAVGPDCRDLHSVAPEDLAAACSMKPRKVASLPAAKAYLGFSRPQQLSPRISKQTASKGSGAADLAAAAKAKSAATQQQATECDGRTDGTHAKITPSSWRAGLRLVRQELGLPVSSGDSAASQKKSSDVHRAAASRSPRAVSAPAAGAKQSHQQPPLRPSRADARPAVIAANSSRSAAGSARLHAYHSSSATAAPAAGVSSRPSAVQQAGGGAAATVSAMGTATAAAAETPDSSEPAAAKGVHAEPISELVKGVASGSLALSDTAKDVLRELQSDAGLQEKRAVSRKIGWEPVHNGLSEHVAVKKQFRSTSAASVGAGQPSAKSRGHVADGRAAASTPPPQKTRHYDAEDIQRYMQRKKSEERRQRAAEAAAKRKADEEHQKKLQELYKKQRNGHRQTSAATRLSQAVSSLRVAAHSASGSSGGAVGTSAVCNDTFTRNQLASSGGSSVGGAPAAGDSDKENRGSGAGSATPTSGSDGPPSGHATPDRSLAAGTARAAVALSERPASVGRDTPSPVSRPVVNGASAAGGGEDEGLLSFADDNLKRILNKYKSRRDSDLRCAASDTRPSAQRPAVVPTVERRLGSVIVETLPQPSQLSGPLSTDPDSSRSHVDRIASIKKATSLLTEKIHAAQARLADYCLSGQQEPAGSVSGQGRGRKEHVVSTVPHASVRSFASSVSDGDRRSVQNRMLNSWPGVGSSIGGGGRAGHSEKASKHKISATSRRVESLSSLSDTSTQESMRVSDAYRDSLLLNETSESQDDKLSDASATDSLTVESKVLENAGVADRIARSLRQSAFCVSSRQSDTENLFAIHPRQLSYNGSAVPQQTVLGGQLFQTGNGFHEDNAYRVLSRSSSPRPYADYYSSINVHLRKASASRRGVTEPGCCLPVRHDHEPATSTGMQRGLQVSAASPIHRSAVHPERARSPEFLTTVAAADASAAAAVDTAVTRRMASSSRLQDVDASLSDSRVLPVDARSDLIGSRNRHFESEDRPIASIAFTSPSDLSPATGAVVAGRTAAKLLPTEPPPVIVQPDQLRSAETLPPKTEDSTGVSRLVSQFGQPYPSVIAQGGADTLFGTSPLGLGFRMAAELNLLDSVEESVRALNDVELTRHAAAAQQEAARLTLLLEGTKHSQEAELRQLRAKVRAEEEEAQRQLEAMRRQAHTAELERDSALDERRRMESQSLTLYHSTRQLVESQMDATRASLEATRSLAEVATAAGRDEHIRRREAAQIAAEAASLSAAAAVTAALDRQRQEQAEFFRMARQHVYDRSVQVTASLKVDSSRSDGKYGTSFESASDASQSSPRDREDKRLSPKTTDEEFSGPNSTPERAMSTSPSVLSQASATDSHSSATVVESEHVRTADVSSVSAVSSVDVDDVGRKHAKTGKQLSDSSIATASSLADTEGGRGRGATAMVHDRSISSIATDIDVNGNARSLRGSITNEESANGSSVKTLSDVQAIAHRQAAVEASKRHASSSSPSASVLTTEAVRLHDRQTAGDRGVLPPEVQSGRGKQQQQLSLDRIGSTSSDGSTVRSEAGAYGSAKAVAHEAADEDYTQDFYETSNASADESSADVRQVGVKRRVAAPAESDKQRSPRVQKHTSAGDVALASTTSPDDTGKVHANRAVAAGASSHSASHALAVVRQLIRDEKLRALHEEQLARAKYRAINYKSKFELQTIATQKEIASLKGNADVVAELETRTATLAESFSRKKAAIQSKLRSDRSYNNSRLESLRERYAELAAAAKDLGAGAAAQLAELSAPLDDVDLSLSESSISSSAGETNVDFTATRTPKGQRSSGTWPVGHVAASSEGREDGRTPNRGTTSVGMSAQSSAPDAVDLSIARTSSALHTEENSAQQCDTEMTSTKRPAASGSPDSFLAPGAEVRAAGQAARRKLLAQQVAAGNSRSRATKHGDSESDDSISMSVPEGGTGSESDTEGRIQALQYQLRLKQKEETRLKRLLTDAERERRRERKRNQETALLKQLELTEENIARLNASLREVQQQRHTPPASDDGSEVGMLLRAVHASSVSASGVAAVAYHEPSASSASITKPLIKQPRAALQQVSASVVSSSPSAAAGPSTVVPSASADTARLPSTVLPSLRSDSEGSLRSSPDVEGESSTIGLVLRAGAEAKNAPDNKIAGDGAGHKQTSPETRGNDLHSAEMVDVVGRDRGDSDEIPKEYSSDSFADSYSSEDQHENDESKSESVPEELPEEVPEDGDFKQSSLRSESDDSTEASRRSSCEPLPRERGRSPTESAIAAPGTGTLAPPQSATLKETGADYSVAESFDFTGGDESLSARPRSLSDSSADSPIYGEVSRPLPDPSLSPLSATPKVEGVPKAAADIGSDDAHSTVPACERTPVGAAADVRPLRTASTDSSIAEDDMPESAAASSDDAMAPENAADVLLHAVQSTLASQADVVTNDQAEPPVEGSAREPSVELDPVAGSLLSSRELDELHVDTTFPDDGPQPLAKHSADELAAERYDSEHFESDFSTASISLPSEPLLSVQSESAATPVFAAGVAGSDLPAVGAFASATTSEPPALAGDAAVSRPGTGDEESVPIVEEALHSGDKRLTPTASESDHEGSDKDASWSGSDDGRVQDVVIAAEFDLKRREEEIVRTSDSGKVPTPTQESSVSESIHESLEHEPSVSADSETSEGLLLAAAAADDVVCAPLPPAVAPAPKDVVNSSEPSVCLQQVASEPTDGSVSIQSSVAPVVEKLADWLLKDAIFAYVTTRNAKLDAARALETANAVTSAPSTSGSTQKSVATIVTPASSTDAVKRDVMVVAEAIAPKGSRKDMPRGHTEVSSSASSASLADLPPLVPKKSLTLREAAGTSTGAASESSRPVTNAPAKQPATTTAAAGGLLASGETKSSSRPLSPVLGGSGIVAGLSSDADDAWNKLDKEINNVFGEDVDWFDEDFGLGVSKKPGASPTAISAQKPGAAQQQPPPPPPPPYPGAAEGLRHASKVEAKVQAPPAPLAVIPEKREDVVSLALRAVDVFWQMRRFGESWEGATPPEQYTAEAVGGAVGLEAASKASHGKMMFDLIGEMLREIYREESESDMPESRRSGSRLKLPSRRYWKGKTPPSTVDELKKVVEQHIFKIIGCQPQVKSIGIGPRARKKDRVDGILIEELRQEEADWVNYTDDEDAVKETVFNDIFNLLIVDTGKSVAEAMRMTQRYSK